jgi:hypothetical protein
VTTPRQYQNPAITQASKYATELPQGGGVAMVGSVLAFRQFADTQYRFGWWLRQPGLHDVPMATLNQPTPDR